MVGSGSPFEEMMIMNAGSASCHVSFSISNGTIHLVRASMHDASFIGYVMSRHLDTVRYNRALI
ncbi:hypothetical protein BLOT_004371 [Blomia tropicalis]|nr:hypothetical protein BLOT_004371 [Blomia tropicalis]